MTLPANKLAQKLSTGLSRAVDSLSGGDEVHLKMEKTGTGFLVKMTLT